MIGKNLDLSEAERLRHCLLPLATASALALVTASANAADAPRAAADPDIAKLVREVSPARLETYVRTLAGFGISASRSPIPGRVTSVWVGNDKIAAIGVHIARWITTHGFALNVTDEALANFAGIVPCGITDGGVTSMQRAAGRSFSVEAVAHHVARSFGEVFGREIIGA